MAPPAAVRISRWMPTLNPEVVDADLANYFGSIPHAELSKSVARREILRGLIANAFEGVSASPVAAAARRRRSRRLDLKSAFFSAARNASAPGMAALAQSRYVVSGHFRASKQGAGGTNA